MRSPSEATRLLTLRRSVRPRHLCWPPPLSPAPSPRRPSSPHRPCSREGQVPMAEISSPIFSGFCGPACGFEQCARHEAITLFAVGREKHVRPQLRRQKAEMRLHEVKRANAHDGHWKASRQGRAGKGTTCPVGVPSPMSAVIRPATASAAPRAARRRRCGGISMWSTAPCVRQARQSSVRCSQCQPPSRRKSAAAWRRQVYGQVAELGDATPKAREAGHRTIAARRRKDAPARPRRASENVAGRVR